jgi:hypothetical protein
MMSRSRRNTTKQQGNLFKWTMIERTAAQRSQPGLVGNAILQSLKSIHEALLIVSTKPVALHTFPWLLPRPRPRSQARVVRSTDCTLRVREQVVRMMDAQVNSFFMSFVPRYEEIVHQLVASPSNLL